MNFFYHPFNPIEWTIAAGLVTFNPDGSVRLQHFGVNADMRLIDPTPIDPSAEGMVLILHGLRHDAGRVRVMTRNFNDTSWTSLIYYPAPPLSVASDSSQSVISGGVRFRLTTDAVASDCSIYRFSLFSENAIAPSVAAPIFNPFFQQRIR